MLPAARVAAAIEILDSIESLRAPAGDIVKEWGRKHRFAGSKDRAAISSLIYEALRRRSSAQWLMGEATGRAAVIGALHLGRGLSLDAIAAFFSGEGHAPSVLTGAERAALSERDLTQAPAWVQGDYPEWLAPHFTRAFGESAIAQGRALAERAPLDMRINRLKTDRQAMLKELAHLEVAPAVHAPDGLRIVPLQEGRMVAATAEPAYIRGLVEIQDEGSQLAALLARPQPGEQCLDLCAGAGGKTLAFASMMGNRGQIYATDIDSRRLAPMLPRLDRSGAHNVQVRQPRGVADPVADLENACDLTMIDAPCTGVGVWRRNPDAKWRIRPGALEQRIKSQNDVLRRGARYVKPGGRLVYVTCSLLVEENEDRIAEFLNQTPEFSAEDAVVSAQRAGLPHLEAQASPHGAGLRFSPADMGVDGFYVVVLLRKQ